MDMTEIPNLLSNFLGDFFMDRCSWSCCLGCSSPVATRHHLLPRLVARTLGTVGNGEWSWHRYDRATNNSRLECNYPSVVSETHQTEQDWLGVIQDTLVIFDNVTEDDLLTDTDSKLIDNNAGFLPKEESGTLQEVIRQYCQYAAQELSDPVYRMDIGTGFVFFSGFEEVSDAFQSLIESGVLSNQDSDEWGTPATIRVVMGHETDSFTKEVLMDLVRGNLSKYDSEAVNILGELLERDLMEIRVVEDARFHAKIYNFYFTEGQYPDETWNGSANFSSGGLSNNIELSLPVQTTFKSRQRLRTWFDNLWDTATEDLDVLEILDEVEESRSVYYSPQTFFTAVIASLDKDYLLEDAPGTSADQLLTFQDFSYRIVMSRLESYGGYILANSVGTGKTYVASQVAKTYLRSNRIGPSVEGRVLVLAPNAVLDDWEEALDEFGIEDEIDVISMGQFQKTHRSENVPSRPTFDERQYSEEYRLIVVDEAHNYRNDSNRRNNLKKVIRSNPEARVLLLSATPINLSPDDLFQLIDLFRNGMRQNLFQKNELHQHYIETRSRFKQLDDYENFNRELLSDIKKIEQELSLKLTWRILADEYEEDLRALAGEDATYHDPDVKEISYTYPSSYRNNIFDEIVPFLNDLNYESAKLTLVGDERYNPDKNVVFFRKWRLYKQLESSVAAFHQGLKNLHRRTQLYLTALENRQSIEANDPENLIDNTPLESKRLQAADVDRIERILEAFEGLDQDTQGDILRRMNADVNRIEQMLERVEKYAGDGMTVPRPDDTKVDRLVELIEEVDEEDQPVLVFSEFISTVEYLGDVLENEVPNVSVRTIHGQTGQSKESFVESFQDGEFDVAITTELLSEGVNLPRADMVVNYDLPYNPTALVQRTGRALRITNPKQVHVRNFTPASSIDRELELYDRLDARLENIVQIAGLDFVVWMMDEDQIEEMHSQEKEEYLNHLEEYKKSLGRDAPEETLSEKLPRRDRIDIVLERAIEEHDVDVSLIEQVPLPDSKPIYTVLKNVESEGLGVIGEVGGTRNVWSEFQPAVQGVSEPGNLTDSDWEQVEELVDEREQSVMREQTVQGNLGQTGEIHSLVRDARDRLSDSDMRTVLTDILTGLENSVFRPDEEDTIQDACEMIHDYPDMVRNIDVQVAQRDGWQRIESVSERVGRAGKEGGVDVHPIAIAKYLKDS